MTSRCDALPCCIDFEASGLHPDSYPIEAGWSLRDGSVKSMPIKPHWSWTYWDHNAEYGTHRLSRARLNDAGVDPREVAEAMNAELKGFTVYSDNKGFDEFWCDVLFEATGLEREFKSATTGRCCTAWAYVMKNGAHGFWRSRKRSLPGPTTGLEPTSG